MKTKRAMLAGLAVAIVCAVAGMMIIRREAVKQTASQVVKAKPDQPGNQARPAVTPPPEPAVPEPVTPEPAKSAGIPPVKPNSQTNATASVGPVATPNYLDPRLDDPVFKESVGRYALSFVGDDPDADDVWIAVINDPGLSNDARQNLIEDLNEDGLSDPQNPGPEDLPLILNRLQLIEELAPYAMDQVNLDAFAEAYKDLANMLAGLPVQ